MDLTFDKLVLLERMELIARLTTAVECRERDKEIALMMIAEIAQSILDMDIVQNQNKEGLAL
ncbi:hypothetical protein SODG_005765 [Sodalis praecaptivus]|uniref:hypothetical protein n=1 Tax=Sodalis praecaptivus TaxID=1239307 RepID=UPI0027EA5A18|nr:hypothetical protein [Sodalis praecaptivus]CAJ1000123.1 hypothetical protein NVIRENTERO_04170 [Sodalis praecaptivus]